MGLFNRNNGDSINESRCITHDGYIYGHDSGIIYHIPESGYGWYEFPKDTTSLSPDAIIELKRYSPTHIIVPGTFKEFNIQCFYFENLTKIELQEGVEEVKCVFNDKNVVDVKLPSTIKKIGAKNYPVVKDLVLPNGVVEISKLFASHDTNLISVNIPGTLRKIPQGAFNQCKNLQRVILNEGVETSMPDAFRGTNNLHTLVLPSTYNGTINLPMDPRGVTHARGNSRYDEKRFAEEQQEILNIKIKRENKDFEFNIRRGEQPVIEIKRNIIKIKCANYPQVISIDCSQLEEGIYNIQNGRVELQRLQYEKKEKIIQTVNQKITQNNSQEEVIENLDIIFQSAYRDYITKREDFISLPGTIKMQIKKQMRALFLEQNFGTSDINYEMFDYLYARTLNEIKYNPTPEVIEGKKLNRPHIKEDVRKKVIVRNIEQNKETLKRQRELILEGQRIALEGQAFQSTEELLEEELEENNGMSM